MTESLRQLVADFVVRVDADGAMKRGEAGINSLKAKFQSLDSTVQKTGQSTQGFFARLGASMRGLGGGGGLGIGGAINASSAGIGRGISGAVAGIATLQNGLAALAGGFIGSQIKSLIDDIGGIGEEAARLGVANDEFQRLRVLAEQNATSVQALGTAFRTIGKSAVDPTKETTAAFQKLGVAVKNSDGTFRARNDLFFDSAMALADVQNESERATLAQQLYGRSAIELLPLLSQGSEGIRNQRAELEKLPVVTDAAIEAADHFGDEWPKTMLRLKAVAGEVLLKVVLPALEALLKVVNVLSEGFVKLTKTFSPMTIGLAALVVGMSPLVSQFRMLIALGGGWGSLVKSVVGSAWKMTKALAPAVAAFLVLEDVFTFFAGGDSLIGRGLEKAFGPGVKKTIDDLRDAAKELWAWLSGEKTDLSKFGSLVNEIGQAIKLMIHDALVALGLRGGEMGLAGLDAYEKRQAQTGGATMVPNARGGETAMAFNPATGAFMPVPTPLAAPAPAVAPGQYGPPPPPAGDISITINNPAPGEGLKLAGQVKGVLQRPPDAVLGTVQ